MVAKVVLVVLLFICTALAQITVSNVYTNDGAPISTINPTHITITGSGFNGATFDTVARTVTVSGIECQNVDVIDDDTLECDAQPGLGQGNVVFVASLTANASAPILNFAGATASVCSSSDKGLYGASDLITICGTNFGVGLDTDEDSDWKGVFRVYVQSVSAKYLTTIHDHEDGRLIVQLPGTGDGKLNPIVVQLGTQLVTVQGATCTFPQPAVSDVISIPSNQFKRKRADSTSALRVDILGQNFGAPGAKVTVTLGGFPCNINVNHVSSTEIRCSVAGSGANSDVVVVVNGFSSAEPNPLATSGAGSAAPTISAVRFDFPNPHTPGFDCAPPNGAVDVNNLQMCNCWSGYAPSVQYPAVDCNLHTVCPGRVAPKNTASMYAPGRPVTSFNKDTLYIKQTAPIVANRRDTIIQLVAPDIQYMNPVVTPGTAGSDQCWYPGILWQKKLNDLDCLDEYYAEIPWSQNGYCGFVEDTDPQNLASVPPLKKFKAALVTTYTETTTNTDGTLVFRQFSNTYLMTVSFARQIVALTSTAVSVTINDPSTSLSIDLLNDAFYDVASHEVMIQFETTILWPYQLDNIVLPGTWTKKIGSTETGSVVATATLASDPDCTTVQDTECSQIWLLKINGTACDLAGSLEFSTGTLLCRDLVDGNAVGCLFTTSTNFTITLSHTDLCDSNTKDVDATQGLTHTMDSFYDSLFSTPQNAFQTGDMVYFQVTLNDPLSSIDAITFNTITVSNDAGKSDTLYFVSTPGELPGTPLAGTQFNVTSEIRQPTAVVSPGTDAVITFQFRLLRGSLQSIQDLSTNEAQEALSLSAVVDIWYHGNQKRSAVVVGAIPSTARTQISYYSVETDMETEEAQTINQDNVQTGDSFSFFSGAAAANSNAGSYFATVVVLSVVSAVLIFA